MLSAETCPRLARRVPPGVEVGPQLWRREGKQSCTSRAPRERSRPAPAAEALEDAGAPAWARAVGLRGVDAAAAGATEDGPRSACAYECNTARSGGAHVSGGPAT